MNLSALARSLVFLQFHAAWPESGVKRAGHDGVGLGLYDRGWRWGKGQPDLCLILEAYSEGTALSSCHKLKATSLGTAENRRDHHLTIILASEELNKDESRSLQCAWIAIYGLVLTGA